jgi:hypothetical protein
MSFPGPPRRSDRAAGSRPTSARLEAGLVRPEFGPTLPVLLRGRGRWLWAAGLAALVMLAAALAVSQATGAGVAPALVVHRQPDFSLLVPEGALRPVAPRGAEYVRLEGRGRRVSVAVTVAPLPRTQAGEVPALADLPIETDRLIDSLRRRHGALVVLEEGRARVNGAPGYQVRHQSGPDGARRLGHVVLLVPEPPATGRALHVTLVQRNDASELGPDDRRLAYGAKRAFRSVRFGAERP